MIKKFSKSWKGSKKKSKKRKYMFQADKNTRHKLMSINLSKELKKEYKIRNVKPRKGDVVKIMRGKFRKKEGKIAKIDLKKYRTYIENIQMTKKDGTKINVPIHPSNLQIKTLNLDDKKRLKKVREKNG